MSNKNPKVNPFFLNLKRWRNELEVLREIVLANDFVEELKWNSPCYTIEGKNVVILQGFKEYFGVLFFKGALLKDSENILSQPGEVQAGRQIRFKSMEEIVSLEQVIRSYILEAIDIEKSGAKVEMKKVDDFEMPNELLEAFAQNGAVKSAFLALTPGRQKAYALHVSDAKQQQTRYDRIEKIIPRILKGKGLTDCICGLSKRMPSCDGSHKNLL